MKKLKLVFVIIILFSSVTAKAADHLKTVFYETEDLSVELRAKNPGEYSGLFKKMGFSLTTTNSEKSDVIVTIRERYVNVHIHDVAYKNAADTILTNIIFAAESDPDL